MKRKFNIIERGTPQLQNGSKIRESLPYIGLVAPSASLTEERANQINRERFDQAYRTFKFMKEAGYSPTLEGYIKKEDKSFVSTHDAHKLCKDKS